MGSFKQNRVLEIFFRALRGEGISVKKLAEEYKCSTKSVTRSINDLKSFLADQRDLVGQTELKYSYQDKCYYLEMDDFLSSEELFAILEVLIGSRAFSKVELLTLVDKLKKFTTDNDRRKMEELVSNEIYHYTEIKHDCDSVESVLLQLINCIHDKREISIDYYKMDRSFITKRIRPASVMFSDYYFYLIAFSTGEDLSKPLYFRIDRIKNITVHRKISNLSEYPEFDEGLLQQRSLLMWPGKLRRIRFEFTGPSVQAVLDKLPTAKILEHSNGKYLIEAETYGDGIKMWLLSQGEWVKVVAPKELVEEMKEKIIKLNLLYK